MNSDYDARLAVLRQLLAWQRDLADAASQPELFDDRIYVLTPDAAIVDLPQGATPVDFAYAVHTSLGHRCRGARIDGVLLPLNTPLKNGQTVDVVTAREGGPSRDWLNPELGFLASPRARAKVRAYFNALQTADTRARGRTLVEKALQREGKTAWRHDDLAQAVGLKTADEMYELLGKDELSLRAIENVLRGHVAGPASDEALDAAVLQRIQAAERAPDRHAERANSRGGVLVVGVDSLLTQLAKCCRPAPPDVIGGFVTRGKGVSIHRSDCTNFRHLAAQHADRVIEVDWGASSAPRAASAALYPVDVAVQANDRQGLLRDISDVFAREKTNVVAVATQSVRGTAWMTFTIEVPGTDRLAQVLAQVRQVAGVQSARRR
jgi:GTP pyrophosphokinase